MKYSQSTYHTQSFSTLAAGWPWKILLMDPLRCQNFGVPWQRTDPCSPSAWLGVSWGMSSMDCSVEKVLCQAGHGGVRLCKCHPELCETRTGSTWHMCSCLCSYAGYWSSWICFRGLVANSHFMCLSEILRAKKAWTTSVRSSSFSILLARKQ